VKRRRLLSIGHSYVVAMNRRLAHELARLDPDRWEVTAVAPKYFHGSNDLRPHRLHTTPDEPCKVVGVDAYGTRVVQLFVYGLKLRSLLAEPWDLVHFWGEPYTFAGAQTAWWKNDRTPLVFYSGQNVSKKYPPPFDSIERYAIGRAAGWLCMGRLVADNLRTRPGYDRLPMAEIPLGTDLARFRPDPAARLAILQQLGWDAEGPQVVGYLGRFVPEKGLDLMTSALGKISSPWRALFVGAGPAEASLRAWAAPHGDRVRICNSVLHDQVPAYLNAMDLMCAPSQTTPIWKEQFGRMLVEAFASGVPVIGSDSGEIPYVVRDSGLIVGEKDEPGWVRAITELLEDREKRADLAARGLARARDEFAWPVVARRYLDFFDAIASVPYGSRMELG
jgi:glycosyltransferase involved in cell wall biosynthesis